MAEQAAHPDAAAEPYPSFARLLDWDDHVTSREEWLEEADRQYPTVRLGLEQLRLDDAELKKLAAGMTAEMADLFECVTSVKKRTEGWAKLLGVIEARLVIALAHAIGEPLPSEPHGEADAERPADEGRA